MELTERLSNDIEQEINWFQKVTNTALTLYFKNEDEFDSVKAHPVPVFDDLKSPYSEIIEQQDLNFEERLVLILALIPIVKPQLLDVFLIKNQNLNCDFSEFGGIHVPGQKGFIPTLETACFILGGHKLQKRFEFLESFSKNHLFYASGILDFDRSQDFWLHQKLTLTHEYIGLFTTGKILLPEYSLKFQAQQIKTDLKWKNLIVDKKVADDLNEIKDWLIHSHRILKDWNLQKDLKAGFRVMFHGPPGTGKTLAATLIGKTMDHPVFRIDLSMIISKFIGETEKNLRHIFDEAQRKNWILFFDEADALFGKRTELKNAHNKYANQEVSYFLQRMETFSGLVILATNNQLNIDDAFLRRFQSMIYFPKPKLKQRRQLWESLFKANFVLENSIDLNELAESYQLTGGEMVNILRYCALEAAKRNKKILLFKDVITGIRREYTKQNKTI